MADRRMFSKTVVESDAFLDMPITARALYFHMGMQADDDGFVIGPKKVQRMAGCSDDDLKLLIAKGFLIPFDSGVVLVRHWKQNNYIRPDRYKATVCQTEFAMVLTGNAGQYELGIPSDYQVVTNCLPDGIPSDYQVVTNRLPVGIPRVGENSIDKYSTGEVGEEHSDGSGEADRPNINTIEAYASNNLRSLSSGNMEMLGSFKEDLPDEVIRYAIDIACGNGKPYWNYVAKILQAWVEAGVKTVGDAKAEREKKPTQTKTKGNMNYQQHDFGSSDYDRIKNNPNEDLERLYGEGV